MVAKLSLYRCPMCKGRRITIVYDGDIIPPCILCGHDLVLEQEHYDACTGSYNMGMGFIALR